IVTPTDTTYEYFQDYLRVSGTGTQLLKFIGEGANYEQIVFLDDLKFHGNAALPPVLRPLDAMYSRQWGLEALRMPFAWGKTYGHGYITAIDNGIQADF